LQAKRLVKFFFSRVIDIINSIDFAAETGKLKCERAISIADCSCLVAAKLAKAKAVFASKENEPIREMKKAPFDMEVVYKA